MVQMAEIASTKCDLIHHRVCHHKWIVDTYMHNLVT